MATKKKGEESVKESVTEPVVVEAPPELPVFDFSGCTLTDEEVEAKEKTEGGAFFRPGSHDVVVQEVKYRGQSKDPNWGTLEVTLEGTGGKTIKDFPMIPFKTPVYKSGEKETMFPWKKFKALCGGLGITVQRSTLESVCKTHFSDLSKLKTYPLKVKVGFQNGYVVGSGDGNNFKIVLGDGNDLVDPKTKDPLLFADRAAAHNYAQEKKLRVDKYVSVLEYVKSDVKNDAAEGGGW